MNDCHLIDDLKKRDNTAYEVIYAVYYPAIERYVLRNNGTADDAKDVFQETLLALMDNIGRHDFELTASLKTYIFSIASNIWLKKLRTARKMTGYTEDAAIPDTTLMHFEQQEADAAKTGLLAQIFSSVTSHCQLLLMKTFLQETRREELIAELGYKNTHTFDNQKYKCLMQARRSGNKFRRAGD